MLLGVVSDTHGHTEFALEATRMLSAMEVSKVIHCGDIGSTEIVSLFEAWPTHFVLGNVDHNAEQLRQAIEDAGQTYCGRFGSLEEADRKIAFLHGDDQRRLDAETQSGNWDLICSGHTHVAALETIGNTVALNPGAIYRANPRSIAVVELPTLQVHHINL